MKTVAAKLLLFLLSLIVVSCTQDADTINSDKKLTQVIVENFDGNYKLIQNYKYDNLGRIVLITNNEGKTISSYEYNTNSKLFRKAFFDYDSETGVLENKEVTEYDFNSENKISGVKETYSYYDMNGDFISESAVNSSITYSDKKMVRHNNSHGYRTEYGYDNNNLIVSIKVFGNDVLKSDMSFSYDANGNCVSGTGPIDEGSLDSKTDNINLSVTYGDIEKKSIFNNFFEYNIVSTGQSFYNLKQILINQQGNRHVESIEWYKYQDYTYKKTYDNVFESNKYLLKTTLSEFPNYLNYGSVTYKWE